MKNNNQKYIAKAALFIPYALCAEKSEEDIKPLIFDTGDYMSNFPEINMMTKCSYLETKNGSIAKFTDHVEFLDRWQFLDDLKQKKVKFLVIPSYPEFEDDDHDFAENIKNVFEAGIDIFDAEEHYYFNPEIQENNKLLAYFDIRYELHCQRAVKVTEIAEEDLAKLRIPKIINGCLLIHHSQVDGLISEYIHDMYDKACSLKIDCLEFDFEDILYENKDGTITKIDIRAFGLANKAPEDSDVFCDIMNGEYGLIVVPSFERMSEFGIFKEFKYSILNNNVIIYGLNDKKGLCLESTYTHTPGNE